MNITDETTFREIFHIPGLEKLSPYFMGQEPSEHIEQMYDIRWGDFAQGVFASWNKKDLSYGFQRLLELVNEGHQILYSVYDDEEIRQDPYKDTVKVLFFPAKQQKSSRFILVIAGGAYSNVASMVESFPVAADFNELGYNVFCLNYRTFKPEFIVDGLMPRPLEDIAAALRMIRAHADEFGVDSDRYAVSGFSAGANLTALWGTKHKGYGFYQEKRPEALFLNYPAVTIQDYQKDDAMRGFYQLLVGTGITEESASIYYPAAHVDSDYPPCFITHCKDDPTVPFHQSEIMSEVLKKNEVRHEFLYGNHGGHGYGRGTDTDVFGWTGKAIRFWEAG